MSDATPNIGEPKESFELDARPDQSLGQLAESGDFDDIHFFVAEALQSDAIDLAPTDDDVQLALLPYEHPDNQIGDGAFEYVEASGFEQASFRDLLNLAIERPELQREFDIVALGTIRTRQVHDDREGETIWEQEPDLDKSVCQWATGLSNLDSDRTLIPVEIYLDKVLRKDALLLVRRG